MLYLKYPVNVFDEEEGNSLADDFSTIVMMTPAMQFGKSSLYVSHLALPGDRRIGVFEVQTPLVFW